MSDKKLLYDPMFAKKPPEGWEDSEKGGVFGKAVTKKFFFILFLVIAISASLFFSFSALGKDKYIFEENDGGIMFSEFNGTEDDLVLNVDYFIDRNLNSDESKPVTAVREYAVCCNEYIDFCQTVSRFAVRYCLQLNL